MSNAQTLSEYMDAPEGWVHLFARLSDANPDLQGLLGAVDKVPLIRLVRGNE